MIFFHLIQYQNIEILYNWTDLMNIISLIDYVALYYFDRDFILEYFDWQEKEIY